MAKTYFVLVDPAMVRVKYIKSLSPGKIVLTANIKEADLFEDRSDAEAAAAQYGGACVEEYFK